MSVGFNTVVLFDMDGTLTPARQKIQSNMIASLFELSRYARIGIVSGSGFEYINEQIGKYLLGNPDLANRIDILACNGTQVYKYNYIKNTYELKKSHDAKKEWGSLLHNKIMKECIKQLSYIHKNYEMPLTGHFISNRGSLINLCPIGRNADQGERKAFEKLDKEKFVRHVLAKRLNKKFHKHDNITMALGGSTSIDIYPTGWDKRFALKEYDVSNFFFVGDKCKEGGNDRELYEALEPGVTSFETSGPSETLKIIDMIIGRF